MWTGARGLGSAGWLAGALVALLVMAAGMAVTVTQARHGALSQLSHVECLTHGGPLSCATSLVRG